jgi:hypothetical protein
MAKRKRNKGQTTQWPKEKGQTTIYKTKPKDRATQTSNLLADEVKFYMYLKVYNRISYSFG